MILGAPEKLMLTVVSALMTALPFKLLETHPLWAIVIAWLGGMITFMLITSLILEWGYKRFGRKSGGN